MTQSTKTPKLRQGMRFYDVTESVVELQAYDQDENRWIVEYIASGDVEHIHPCDIKQYWANDRWTLICARQLTM